MHRSDRHTDRESWRDIAQLLTIATEWRWPNWHLLFGRFHIWISIWTIGIPISLYQLTSLQPAKTENNPKSLSFISAFFIFVVLLPTVTTTLHSWTLEHTRACCVFVFFLFGTYWLTSKCQSDELSQHFRCTIKPDWWIVLLRCDVCNFQAYLEFFTSRENAVSLKEVLTDYPNVNYHIIDSAVSITAADFTDFYMCICVSCNLY